MMIDEGRMPNDDPPSTDLLRLFIPTSTMQDTDSYHK
jgi:hypothetical protein